MVHYILLGLYALAISAGTMTHQITPRLGLENQYFFHNTRNVFNVPVQNDLYATGILSVKTEITVFKMLDLYFGTRGWYGHYSFQAGGMYWGARARITPNIFVYFRHDSIHAFDNAYNRAGLPSNAHGWGQDQLGFMLHYNFDDSGKSSLYNMIFGR